jgi:hypothetical protein
MGHIENDASNNSSIACIRYRGEVSTEPMPSNDGGIHTHTQQRDLISLLYFLDYFRILENGVGS